MTRCKQCKIQKGKAHKMSCSSGKGWSLQAWETVTVSTYYATDYGYDTGSSSPCSDSSNSSDFGSGGGCD